MDFFIKKIKKEQIENAWLKVTKLCNQKLIKPLIFFGKLESL